MRNPFVPRRKFVTDELPWQAIFSHRGRRRVVYTDDGAWMMTAAIAGPDLDYEDLEARFRIMCRFNAAFLRLGAGHAMWFEEQHVPFDFYPSLAPPDEAARLFEIERSYLFTGPERRHHTTRAYLTLLYRPPVALLNKLTRALVNFDDEGEERSLYAEHLDRFVNRFERLIGLLTFMREARILENGDLLTYLHSCISTKMQEVADIDWDEQLPGSLVDQPFTGGMRPRLGHEHEAHDVRVISVHNYPRWIEGALLRRLRDLPVRWRRVSRWFPMDRFEADKEIKRAWSKAAMARKPMGVQVMETVQHSHPTSRINVGADQLMHDAAEAEAELSQGTVSRGYLTNTVSIIVPADASGVVESIKQALGRMADFIRHGFSPEEAAERAWPSPSTRTGGGASSIIAAQEVERIMLDTGLVCEIETFNSAEAILGSMPGNLWHDVTRHAVNSAAASCCFPLDSPWLGEPETPHLGGPAIMQTTRGACTPFHLNLHPDGGDVGHFLMTGWTGSGKSTLQNALVLSHRARWPHGQIFRLDKGRSSLVTTLALGGRFVDFLRDGSALQPLRYLDTPQDQAWAYSFIIGLATLADPGRALNTEVTDMVTDTVKLFAGTVDPDDRTMSNFHDVLQDFWLKSVVRPYTRKGMFGHIFDGVDGRSWDDPVVSVEIGPVLNNPSIIGPLASFLFHLATRRAAPDRPMLFLGDEAQEWMRHPWVKLLEDFIRSGRGRDIQLGLGSQSILDYARSDLASIFMGNCPTRIFLPDKDALQPDSVEILSGYGLRYSQIEAIANAIPKKQYAASRKSGEFAVFDLELGPVGLALCAATNTADQEVAERVLTQWGEEHFLWGWLHECGLPDAAAAMVRQPPQAWQQMAAE